MHSRQGNVAIAKNTVSDIDISTELLMLSNAVNAEVRYGEIGPRLVARAGDRGLDGLSMGTYGLVTD